MCVFFLAPIDESEKLLINERAAGEDEKIKHRWCFFVFLREIKAVAWVYEINSRNPGRGAAHRGASSLKLSNI